MPLHIATRADDIDKHLSDVNSLVFRKGKLYSAANDGKIKVWSQDLTKLGEVQAHDQPVFCLAASEESIYSCSNDGTIKAWDLESLKSKRVVAKEDNTEYWAVKYVDGVLYAADDQCNVIIAKNGGIFGMVNVAEPVKDLAIYKNILFSVKDNDVSVTELNLTGDKLRFTSKAPVMGRAPLFMINNKLAFVSRSGKDILIYETTAEGHLNKILELKDAHEMIINAFTGASWDGNDYLFSGGWDKLVKQWKFDGKNLKAEDSLDVDITVNALTVGEKGLFYAGGSDGHIVRVDL